ncbi:hypothetical protein SUGI_0016640 [Cryptomeria japonica]|nr:hypothetical protein SUGI_0016640 [Cryptomeria japonica]
MECDDSRIWTKWQAFVEVERAAEALFLAVEEDFLPIILRVKAVVSPLGSGAKGEICYSKDHESIWFKGKCFALAVWANTPWKEQMQNLIPTKDAKGKKVGTEWYTTPKVEEALDSYREAVVQAEILRRLAEELQRRTNTIVFLSVLSVITKTLFAHSTAFIKNSLDINSILSTAKSMQDMPNLGSVRSSLGRAFSIQQSTAKDVRDSHLKSEMSNNYHKEETVKENEVANRLPGDEEILSGTREGNY